MMMPDFSSGVGKRKSFRTHPTTYSRPTQHMHALLKKGARANKHTREGGDWLLSDARDDVMLTSVRVYTSHTLSHPPSTTVELKVPLSSLSLPLSCGFEACTVGRERGEREREGGRERQNFIAL